MSEPDSVPSPNEAQNEKKKKRKLGSFTCPDCSKNFTRTDHLARHRLNHKPKELFECDFVVHQYGDHKQICGKTFVRRDLKERHYKRHLDKRGIVHSSSHSSPYSGAFKIEEQLSATPSHDTASLRAIAPAKTISQTVHTAESPLQISNLIHNGHVDSSKAATLQAQAIQPRATSLPFIWESSKPKIQQKMEPKPDNHFMTYANGTHSQNDILSWLFTDSPPNAMSSILESSKTASLPQLNSPSAFFPIPSPGFVSNMSPTVPGIPDNTMEDLSTRLYDFSDAKVFQSDGNPLDEVFLRNYAQTADDRTNLFDKLTPFNFSIPSSVSAASPTSTNESNHSPNQQEKSPHGGFCNVHDYGSTFNLAANQNLYIDKSLVDRMLQCIPTVKKKEIEELFNDSVLLEDRFSYYLSIYWLVFHPQFNCLHRPSFRTTNAEPALLLTMVIVGCCYSTPASNFTRINELRYYPPEYRLCLKLARPLRFMIFQHEDFKSPCKLWILQSLNLLEWCETNFLSKDMHERSHIHHATTVQLLIRSPMLGGNPIPKKPASNGDDVSDAHENNSDDNSDDYDLFVKWVESESWKRITYMTFYLDIVDYVKFRHNPHISFFQMQLMKLPCDDDYLWEATEINGSFYKIVKRQRKLHANLSSPKKRGDQIHMNENFLDVIKKLLKNTTSIHKRIKTTPFTKKILFGGLISIMHQMQESELMNTSSLISGKPNSNFSIWKEVLTGAIDNFNMSVGEACTHHKLDKAAAVFMHDSISRCKFSIYHTAQIIGVPDVNNYDIAIFGGAPFNQSINTTAKDQLLVQRKLQSIWINRTNLNNIHNVLNLKSVIHCYLLLWETLLDNGRIEGNEWPESVDHFDELNSIGIACTVLWCYCYTTCGVESSRYSEVETRVRALEYSRLEELAAESGREYLSRIRQEFRTNLKKEKLHNSHNIEQLNDVYSKVPASEIIFKYCSILSNISNKQNISGLCFMVAIKLFNSQWHIMKMNAKVIFNCGFRSIGKAAVEFSDIFDMTKLEE